MWSFTRMASFAMIATYCKRLRYAQSYTMAYKQTFRSPALRHRDEFYICMYVCMYGSREPRVHTTGINAHINEEYVRGEGKEKGSGTEGSYFRNKATVTDQPTAIRKVPGMCEYSRVNLYTHERVTRVVYVLLLRVKDVSFFDARTS